MEHRKNFDKDPKEKEFVEKLVTLNRTAKTVKGGRRMSFAALTIVGDQKGRVGYGLGKANDVSEAIKKSIDRAKRNMIVLPLKNGTIPHDIIGKYKSSSVLLKPACSGTGIIAGGVVRAIMRYIESIFHYLHVQLGDSVPSLHMTRPLILQLLTPPCQLQHPRCA